MVALANQFLTTGEVAVITRQTQYTVMRRCRNGELPAVKLPGGGWRIRRD
jgi:excisionase family DNA binding protein